MSAARTGEGLASVVIVDGAGAARLLYVNAPTPAGRALGAELSRLCDGALDGRADHRCATCAFRAGTDPNGCAGTLMDATKCMVEGAVFECHEREGPCAGWAAMRSRDAEPGTAPWPYFGTDAAPLPPPSEPS